MYNLNICINHSTGTNTTTTCVGKRLCNQFSDRCFVTAGSTLWNSLPEQLRQPDITFGQFKRSLRSEERSHAAGNGPKSVKSVRKVKENMVQSWKQHSSHKHSQSFNCTRTKGNVILATPVYGSKRSPASDCYNASKKHPTNDINVPFPMSDHAL